MISLASKIIILSRIKTAENASNAELVRYLNLNQHNIVQGLWCLFYFISFSGLYWIVGSEEADRKLGGEREMGLTCSKGP